MENKARVSLVLTDEDGEMSEDITLPTDAVLLLCAATYDLLELDKERNGTPQEYVKEIDRIMNRAVDWIKTHKIE